MASAADSVDGSMAQMTVNSESRLDAKIRKLLEEYGVEAVEDSIQKVVEQEFSLGPSVTRTTDNSTNNDDNDPKKREQLLQEQALQDSTLVRSAILDASFDSMVAINLEGTIEMVNQATVQIFGYDAPESLVGNNVDCIVGGGFASLHDTFLKRYRETGKTKLIGTMREMSARKKNGTEFPVIIGIKRVERTSHKDGPLMVAFIRDITSRKEAERLQQQSLQEQKVRSAILDASFDAMFAINTFGIIQMVNRAAVEQFGYESREDLLGQNINVIVGGKCQ